MTFWLKGMEALASETPALTTKIPTYAETVAAGWRADRLERNVFNQRAQYETALIEEIEAAAGVEPLSPAERMQSVRRGDPLGQRRRRALAARKEQVAKDPMIASDLPFSDEAFWPYLQQLMRRDYGDADAVLGNAPEGRIGAQTLGRLGSGLIDPVTLATAPLGAPGRAAILTTMMIEGGVNAAAEAMMIPERQEMAEYLDAEDPNPLLDIATAGVLGAGLGGLVAGAARYAGYVRARGQSSAASRPPARTEAEHATRISSAVKDLEQGRLPDRGAMPGVTFDAEAALDRLEADIGRRLNVTSAFRDPARNARVGGAKGSQHIQGTAFDIDVSDLSIEERRDLIVRAKAAGFRGVGVYANSLHFDVGGERAWGPSYGRDSVPDWAADVVGVPSKAHPSVGAGRFVDTTTTSRGYTAPNQVATAQGTRVDVEWQVVDLASLKPATGDLQWRNRAETRSDAQIRSIAAALDPALLMPGPYADRGAPIVGFDDVVESGNGRVGALRIAYGEGTDRAAAYRQAVLDWADQNGVEVPAGIENPVVVGRAPDRPHADRVKFAVEANDAGVAELSPAEAARVVARQLTTSRLATADLSRGVGHDANRGFVRSLLSALPPSQVNRLVGRKGALNADGRRLVENALFARAWDAPDLAARAIDSEEAGEFRALLGALQAAAPDWAALRADIEAALVAPEYDIGGEVLDAMRLIAEAREIGARFGKEVGAMVEDLLGAVDLLDGAISPLTAALVRKFHPEGRAVPADEIAGFLKTYAGKARELGRIGDMAGAVPVARILRDLDARVFGDLPADFARAPVKSFEGWSPVRGADLPEGAFADGASSPEAEAADLVATEDLRAEMGPFGPVFRGYEGDPEGAIARLKRDQRGEALGVLEHPEVPGRISLVWGEAGDGSRGSGHGIAKIALRHEEILDDLQGRLAAATTVVSRSPNRIRLENDRDFFVVRLTDQDGGAKTWLLTGYEKRQDAGRSTGRSGDRPEASSASALPDAEDTLSDAADQDDASLRAALEAFDAEDAALLLPGPDGEFRRAGDLLDELDADDELVAVLDACGIGKKATP